MAASLRKYYWNLKQMFDVIGDYIFITVVESRLQEKNSNF